MRAKYKFEVYEDMNSELRWRVKRNGRIIAEASEGYKRKSTMLKSLKHLIAGIQENSFMLNNQTLEQ